MLNASYIRVLLNITYSSIFYILIFKNRTFKIVPMKDNLRYKFMFNFLVSIDESLNSNQCHCYGDNKN